MHEAPASGSSYVLLLLYFSLQRFHLCPDFERALYIE